MLKFIIIADSFFVVPATKWFLPNLIYIENGFANLQKQKANS